MNQQSTTPEPTPFLVPLAPPSESMVASIAGMHRSGTSMVATLLKSCGLYLGREDEMLKAGEDNPQGFCENREFVQINDEILNHFGGAWDCPGSLPDQWETNGQFSGLTARGEVLLRSFEDHRAWAWKDPRNSLTLPFWKKLIPNLNAVVCLRNPLEVALSLHYRNGISQALGLTLWTIYNQRILAAIPPAERVITHYDSYFTEPRHELRRVASFLKIHGDTEAIERTCDAISPSLRHRQFTIQQLTQSGVSPAVVRLYLAMCDEAGWVDDGSRRHRTPKLTNIATIPENQLEAMGVTPKIGAVGRLNWAAVEGEEMRSQLAALRPALTEKVATISELQSRLQVENARAAQLELELKNAIEESERRFAGMADERNAALARIDDLSARSQAAFDEIARLQAATEDRTELTQRIEELSINGRNAHEEIARLQEAIVDRASLVQRIEELSVDGQNAHQEIARLQEAILDRTALTEQIAELSLDRQNAHQEIARLQEVINAHSLFAQEVAEISAQRQTAYEEIGRLQEALQDRAALNRQIEELSAERQIAYAEIARLQEAIVDRHALTQRIDDLSSENDRAGEALAQLATITANRDELLLQVEALRISEQTIEAALVRSEKIAATDRNALATRVDSLYLENRASEAEIVKLRERENQGALLLHQLFHSMDAEVRNLRADVDRFTRENGDFKQQAEAATEQIKQLEERIGGETIRADGLQEKLAHKSAELGDATRRMTELDQSLKGKAEIESRLVQVEQELDSSLRELAGAENVIAEQFNFLREADEVKRAHYSLVEREENLRKMLLDTHEELLRRDAELQTARTEITQLTRIVTANSDLEDRVVDWQQQAEKKAAENVTANKLLVEERDLTSNRAAEIRELRGLVAVAKQQGERAAKREREMRMMLLDAHEQLLRRDDEIQAMLATWSRTVSASQSVPADPAPPAPSPALQSNYLRYQQCIREIRDLVKTHLPPSTTLLVVSKGDRDLLDLENRLGWHFPQTEDGRYAGHHPADSQACIAQLEALRARGAEYLLLPMTSFWWLDHYVDFRLHLEKFYDLAVEREGVCKIFALTGERVEEKQRYKRLIEDVRAAVHATIPPDEHIAVVSQGDAALLAFEGRAGRHFPFRPEQGGAEKPVENDEVLIAQLESDREDGTHFFVLPTPSFGMIAQFPRLANYLAHSSSVAFESESCRIYRLNDARPTQPSAKDASVTAIKAGSFFRRWFHKSSGKNKSD